MTTAVLTWVRKFFGRHNRGKEYLLWTGDLGEVSTFTFVYSGQYYRRGFYQITRSWRGCTYGVLVQEADIADCLGILAASAMNYGRSAQEIETIVGNGICDHDWHYSPHTEKLHFRVTQDDLRAPIYGDGVCLADREHDAAFFPSRKRGQLLGVCRLCHRGIVLELLR